MTHNYWMMVERYPNLKEKVGGSNHGFEISSLLDTIFFGKWSTASSALPLASRPSVSQKKKKKEEERKKDRHQNGTVLGRADFSQSLWPSTSKNLELKGKENCNPSQNR
jgi:hypothetical protein